jgi:enoyl-CoA hydratase/carnithine racemase
VTTAGGPVAVRVEGRIGHILLNRPGAMNAITVELARQLAAALPELAERVAVIVIRGAGGNFCVGGDFHELQRLRADGPAALLPLFEGFAAVCAAIAELPVPVVAAVEGYAMAGGFELMQACDIAVVRADAVLADNHVNFGQIPGGGGSQLLPRLVGRQRALGHLLTGERVSGAQAAEWGLAYRSLPADEFEAGVAALLDRVAAKDPVALRKIKNLVYRGSGMPLPAGLAMELASVVEHVVSDGAGAEITAFTKGARHER